MEIIMKLATGAHLITAVAMLVLCTSLVIAGYQLLYWDGYAPASGFSPIWVGLIGIVLSGLMLFQIGTKGYPDESAMPTRSEAIRVGAATLGLWLFVVASPFVGTLPMTAVFVLFLLLCVLRRPPMPSIITTVVTALLVYGIFVVWLKVPLPKGILGF